MSPQPKIQKPDDAQPAGQAVVPAQEAKEPRPQEPQFAVGDLKVRGDAVLGRGFGLPDIRAALAAEPEESLLTVSAAKERVSAWLREPVATETPGSGA